MEQITYYNSAIGKLEIGTSTAHITRLKFAGKDADITLSQANALSDAAIRQINEYLAGLRKHFDLPFHAEGTDFQQQVWRALCDIEYGTTSSYQTIAKILGKPNAARAIGMANNKNPIAIIIPCHRVIGTNGKLVGYAGGLSVKEKLLELERKITQ